MIILTKKKKLDLLHTFSCKTYNAHFELKIKIIKFLVNETQLTNNEDEEKI
jgi:hypothetical protein